MTFTPLVTTNEPPDIKNLFLNCAIFVPMHFDFMLYTLSGTVSVERKHIPEDLISSVTDGRLTREMQAMRAESNFQIILLHGKIEYYRDGSVKLGNSRHTGWTRKAIRNLKRTLQYVEGMYIEEAETDQELVDVLIELQDYFDLKHSKHLSFKGRPALQSSWNTKKMIRCKSCSFTMCQEDFKDKCPVCGADETSFMPYTDPRITKQERLMYFYMGIPSVSPTRAKELSKVYTNPLDIYSATIEDLQKVDRIGTTVSKRIYDFLRTGE